ncbi:ABC transporter substrate-binding protein [Auritidibacter ignavus]|nr:ABC transporter substrate-binding protein [Auritidibacter ignavus]
MEEVMNSVVRRWSTAGGAVVLAASLAACSTGATGGEDEDSGSDTGVAAAEDAFPRTVEHAFGETTIEEEPETVVAIGWINGDILMSLDVVPAGMGEISWGTNENGSTDWIDAQLDELDAEMPTQIDEGDGINFSEIAQLEPDLIVNVIGAMSQEDYDQLSEIADVVAFDEGGENYTTGWDEATLKIGDALGRPDDAQEVVDRVSETLAGVTEDNEVLQDKTILAGRLSPDSDSKVGIYAPNDTRPIMFEHMGFELAPVMDEIDFAPGEFSGSFSAERASELESDLFYTWADDQAQAEAIPEDPQLQHIPALQNDAMIIQYDNHQANAIGTSPAALEWLVEESGFVDELIEAAENAETAN